MSVKVTTDETSPDSAPVQLTATESPGDIRLSWQPPVKRNGKITGYMISYKQDDAENWTVENVLGDALTCPIGNVEPDTGYIFKILAQNSKGPGPYRQSYEMSLFVQKIF